MPTLLRYLILASLTLWLTGISAQFSTHQDSIGGFWSGILSQQENGYAAEYDFSLQLEQTGDFVSGRAKVATGDIQGEFSVTGQRQANGSWVFTEERLIFSKKPSRLEWCNKRYELRVSVNSRGKIMLVGPWWGSTQAGACIPGRIEVWRPGNRV